MAFPINPTPDELYTTPLGTVYKYNAVSLRWELASTTLQGVTGMQGIQGQTGVFSEIPVMYAFSAKCNGLNRSDYQILANGNGNGIICNEEYYDLGNNYDTTTGIFTAPVNGIYSFQAILYLYKAGSSTFSYIQLGFVKTVNTHVVQEHYLVASNTYYLNGLEGSFPISKDFYLEAGDLVNFGVILGGSGYGIISFFGQRSSMTSQFSGHYVSGGSQGVTGLQGPQGDTGIQGDTGFGIQGSTGLQGPIGSKGVTGVQGFTGLTGLKGDTGTQGIQGPTGAYGGPQGVTGPQGPASPKYSFSAYGGYALNATGDDTVYQVVCGYVEVDHGACYNEATGVFTAPQEGDYHFDAKVVFAGLTGEHLEARIYLNRSGHIVKANNYPLHGTTEASRSISVTVPLAANETAYITVQVTSGPKAVDIQGSAFFSGYMISGIKGDTGIRGVTGPAGAPQGDTGIQGLTGLRGQTGIQGTTGLRGPTGIQGLTGAQAVQGDTGAQGRTGLQGIQGVTGFQGPTGIQGLQGYTGNQGVRGVTGAQGLRGFQGNRGFTGVQGPTGSQGQTGLGITGLQGTTGVQGITGLQGETGLQGIQGIQGQTGLSITGLQGPTGAYGGPQGATGIQGATGVQGTMPTRYSFLAYTSSSQQDVTGDGTVVSPVPFGTEVFDTGSCFTGSTFTCPVTGKYSFNVQIVSLGGGGARLLESILVTTKRNYVFSTQSQQFSTINVKNNLSVIADMDQNDTAYVTFTVSGTTKSVDIIGHATDIYTFFSGALVE